MLIHRKGATRALPAEHPDNPKKYLKTGHPVLIPGSMGTASYIIRAEPGVEAIYNSVNHGAGRVMSRTSAKKEISVESLKKSLGEIIVSGPTSSLVNYINHGFITFFTVFMHFFYFLYSFRQD